jgi:hypothetical protein
LNEQERTTFSGEKEWVDVNIVSVEGPHSNMHLPLKGMALSAEQKIIS